MSNVVEYLFSQFSFPSYIIEVGVISDNGRKEEVQLGINNAQLMYIQENGSPLNHIPARPVLQMTVDWVNESGLINEIIDSIISTYIESKGNLKKVDTTVEKYCIKIQNYARKLIYDKDPRLTPNSPRTIKQKGSDTPLLDTGQLVRSITCRKIRI